MDSDLISRSPLCNAEEKPSFRKPSNDLANRKYRHRSPVGGGASSSPDGSPKQSENGPKEDPTKNCDDLRKNKSNGSELDVEPARVRSDKSHSYRNSEKDYYGSSRDYSRHDDYDKRHKHTGRENGYDRSRDYSRKSDKHAHDSDRSRTSKDRERDLAVVEREKHKEKESFSDRAASSRRHAGLDLDGIQPGEQDRKNIDRGSRDHKRDFRKTSGDYKDERSSVFRESRLHGKDSVSRSSFEEFRGHGKDSIKDWESEKPKERYTRNLDEKVYCASKYRESHEKSSHVSDHGGSPAKKHKFFDAERGTGNVKDEFVSKTTCVADEQPPSSSNLHPGTVNKVNLGPPESSFNKVEAAHDLNAAKVAAMKAAELVNRNLIGGGYMSAGQKKKLLWGNKKSTAAEESGHRWDSTLFPDKERQEKFNKLMSLRLPWYLWPLVGCEGRCETRSKQRRWWGSPPSRKAGATPNGSREAIHCWTSSKRWPYSRAWFVIFADCAYCTLLQEGCLMKYLLCYVRNVLV
ncbi:hypothetical protein GIB67_040031 [Kingdonia uniflora]|uniref:Arginine/serine-rich coiled-coil protein 2 n=1 Tax=Kingdonia uniflora TaxID=39325 RepID=A0A7J7MUM1_9MAGN|nr:hypothetical protein GIB67_040031 [Kingdonia uniflora]